MIQVKVSDGKTECVVDGEPAIIAAELTAIESAVYEQVGKRSMADLIAVGIIRNSITHAIANNAYEKARYTPPCERMVTQNDKRRTDSGIERMCDSWGLS